MEKLNSTQEVSQDEFLSGAMSLFLETQFSFALWRLPNTSSVHLAASDRPMNQTEVNLEEMEPGFIFSPFNPAREKIFLPADEYFAFESGHLISTRGSKQEEIQQRKNTESVNFKKFYRDSTTASSTSIDEAGYKKLVNDCRDEVIRGNFEKIVPLRSKSISLEDDFDIIDSFNRLCQLYPYAMVSVFSSPMTGTWMGATPELLVSLDDEQHFHTVAIAGTQPFQEGMDLGAIAWTQKDIQEQALVERYIISCFKKIRVREYDEHGPKTIVAGNLLHLKTDFDVDMAAINFPQLGTVMLKLLHPTSAVCGMPMENSLGFLIANEGYDRQFYSGYLGPVKIQQETHLFVNIRCMQFLANEAVLYAGAGVMADSDPEKEWKETEMKMATLQRVIRK